MHRTRTTRAGLAALAALGLAVTACGDDDDPPSDTPAVTTNTMSDTTMTDTMTDDTMTEGSMTTSP